MDAYLAGDTLGDLEVPHRPRGVAPAARLRRAGRVGSRAARRVLTSPPVWLCLLAALFYGSLAMDRVDQHIAASYDFGVIFQVIHGWAFHGYPSEPLNAPTPGNEWGDHFAPILMLLAPLLWIHDAPNTIAVAQAVVISSAGIPVYYAVRRMHGPIVGATACVFYLSCIEVQNAVGFDIHENMFEPLLIGLAIERSLAGKWTAASIAIGLTLFCYEDMGAVVVLFGLWAAWHRKWRHAAVLCLVGPAVMFLYTGVIVPDWGHDLAFWQVRHFDYGQSLGASTMGQALAHSIEHPRHFLHLLVDNRVKTQTWLLLLAPVGFVCLASPITYLGSTEVLLLMVSDNNTHWSTHYHFYLQVAPIIVIGAADGVRRIGLVVRVLWRALAPRLPSVPIWPTWLTAGRIWRTAVVLLAIVAVGASIRMETRPDRRVFTAGWVYLNHDYTRPAKLNREIDAVAAAVPPGANVYVSNDLGTAVVAKDTDVVSPKYAKYVFFDTGTNWTPPDYEQNLRAAGFRVIDQEGPVVLMERGPVS